MTDVFTKLNQQRKLGIIEMKSQFAARIGVSRGRVSQLVGMGLPVEASGDINIKAGLAWVKENIARHVEKPESGSLTESRKRAADALAAAREFDLALKRGEYVNRTTMLLGIRAQRQIVYDVLGRLPEKFGQALAEEFGLDKEEAENWFEVHVGMELLEIYDAAPPPSFEKLKAAALKPVSNDEYDCDFDVLFEDVFLEGEDIDY